MLIGTLLRQNVSTWVSFELFRKSFDMLGIAQAKFPLSWSASSLTTSKVLPCVLFRKGVGGFGGCKVEPEYYGKELPFVYSI